MEQHSQSAASPTSSPRVKTNFIKRSQARGPTIREVINQKQNSCHGVRDTVGGLVGKASQKMTHAFPDLLVQFPLVSSSLIRNVGVIRENVIGGLFITGEQSIPRWAQTNILHRAYAVPAGKLRRVINDTSAWIHASLTHNHSEIHSRTCSIANTRTHRNSSKASCAQSIVATITRHMWLICPWQFPSRSGDGLQREIEQSRGGHMTSPRPNRRSHKHTG